jgi:nucleotide-binding universal stress UspA family protein
MKRIIVPIDFSEHSEFALKTAVKLAQKNNTELFALHMLEMSDAILTETDAFQHEKAAYFMKLAQQRFEKFLDKDYLKGIRITPVVKHFKVWSEVNDVAKENNADLIVMGSHGVSGVKEFFIGSNTERVVRNAEIPVLVVKKDRSQSDIETVVLGVDFAEDSVESYQKATKIFDDLGYTVHLLYVNLPNDTFKSSTEIRRDATEFFNAADGNLDRMKDLNYVSDYTVEQGVINYSQRVDADLIAILTHGRKGISHFFEGSIGEDIANHSPLPVITFRI